MIFFLVFMLVNYVVHSLYFNYYYQAYIYLDFIWVLTSLSAYPLYYYYIRLLTVDKKVDFKWIWILVPALTLSIFTFVVYLLMSPYEIDTFIHEVLYHNRVSNEEYSLLINLQKVRINLFKFIFGVQVFLVFLFGFRLINRFNKRVCSFYSNVENREMSKIRTLLIFLLLASIVSVISNFIGKDYFTDYPYLLALPSITHSIVLFGISYVGYKQHFTIIDLCEDTSIEGQKDDVADVVISEGLVGDEYDLLFMKIEELFEKQQVYKDTDLRMNEIAMRLGTNRTYVSRLIHNRTNLSFCDFVNNYRVQHAEEMLSSPDASSISMEEVALESGFSGTSSFYRAFQKKNGIPPGKYRKQKV